MYQLVIIGSGVFMFSQIIMNDEFVVVFNVYVDKFNVENVEVIVVGNVEVIVYFSVDFIFSVSGIEQCYVMEKESIFNLDIMFFKLCLCFDDESGIMVEMVIDVCNKVFVQVGCVVDEVDFVICVVFNYECVYLVIVVEIQDFLGVRGFVFDMNVVCFLVIFGLQVVVDMICVGLVKCVLVVNFEICLGYLEWCDCDCYFIFGDVCIVIVIEWVEDVKGVYFFVYFIKCVMQFFNNICNNNGYLCCLYIDMEDCCDMQFMQNGCKVFKEVLLLVVNYI